MKSKLAFVFLAFLVAVPLSACTSQRNHTPTPSSTTPATTPSPVAPTPTASPEQPPTTQIDIEWLRREAKRTLESNRVTQVRSWNGYTETVTYHAPSLDYSVRYPPRLPSWLHWAWNVWWWLRAPWEVNYPHQWFWDSCANAIVLSHYDVKEAEAEIDALLYAQQKDGFLPHMIWNDDRLTWVGWILRMLYPSVHISPYLHPPSLAEAVLAIYQRSGDIAYVKKVLPALDRYYQYLQYERVRGADELPQIIISYESSKDRSPEYDLEYSMSNAGRVWFGPMARLLVKHWSVNWNTERIFEHRWFQVKDALFDSIYARNLSALADLCTAAGQPEDAAYFQQRANMVEHDILTEMYDPATGLFFSLDSRTPADKPLKVNTLSSLMPLILNTISEDQVERLVNDHLLNPKEYWLNYPLPVEAASNGDPDPPGHVIWRGTQTWIFTNWYIVQGLRRQAERFPEHREKYLQIADQITLKTYQLVRQQGFREYYDSNTGEGRGAEHFSWTTLILDMLGV